MLLGQTRPIPRLLWGVSTGMAFMLAALSTAPATAQTNTRPLSDFINAQHVNAAGSPYILWTDPTTNRLMVIDYSGKVNDFVVSHGGPSVGTTVSGTIMERPLKDGTAEVSVMLHLQNAIVWASQGTPAALVFGHTPLQIVGGGDPALATVNLTLKFINSAPGAPLEDLSTIVFTLKTETFQQLNAIGQGTFRAAYGVSDGTPGVAQTTQTGTLQSNGSGGPRDDFFPAEHIDFHVTGQ